MYKKVVLLLLVLSFQYIDAQITLTHNIGNTPIKTDITSCEREEYWARTFKLSDFGISRADQFMIKSGQVAISNSYNGARLVFNVYSIDANFPDSKPKPISYGNLVLAPSIGDSPEIVQIDFGTPIIIPAGIERILVEVVQTDDIYNSDYTKVVIAGTDRDNDISWFKGCRELYTYTSTENLSTPVPNANFFINVTGEKFSTTNYGSTATLTHNVCDDIIKTRIYGCSTGGLSWSRDFVLEDFGVSVNEEFIINSGQVALSYVNWGVDIKFNIYKIDDNFPASFLETDLIGSSQVVPVSYFGSNTGSLPRIIDVKFETPVIIPNNVSRILVEVYQSGNTAFLAGTVQDNGVSWFRSYAGGCTPYGDFFDTSIIGYPDAKFYINVTGDVHHVTNNFEMNISNICSEFLKEFSVENKANIASVLWDFGDPVSGADNVSTDLSPFHDFSADGKYTITATVSGNDGSVETLTETMDIKEPPNAYGINNFYACEDNYNSGISSGFNLSMVEQQVLGGQTNKIVTYIDGSGNRYTTLPNPFTNTVRDSETITVRVSHKDNPCCSSETTFDLIVHRLPDLTSVSDLYVCNNDTDGFAFFNLQQVQSKIIDSASNIDVEFYHENGEQIKSALNTVENLIINEEEVTVRATNTNTNCFKEITFKLMVNPLPVANTLNELVGCDDNNDGISEYFDTSTIESTVLGGQTGLEISYYDSNGNRLQSPFPNPYTNSVPNQETFMVRVTNTSTGCFAETPLVLSTSAKPKINQPDRIVTCDEGNGYGKFDTSTIEAQLIGNQSGLTINYFDSNGNELPSPLPASFKNTEPWNQTIYIKVENSFNNLCISETSVDLVVQELPTVNLNQTYSLCNLEPNVTISVDPNLDFYEWRYEDGTLVSSTYEVKLIEGGNYNLTVGRLVNDTYCENTFDFELIRSILPTITDVKYQDLSTNNYIKIIASGDGDFEYSIDGINYQKSSEFYNVLGGFYNIFVRDKYGCGEDSTEITLIDYPKFFTPNSDGYNDYWHILGIENFPKSSISIFDRYGKLIAQLDTNSVGWDGTYNGNPLPSTDYWFKANLGSGKIFSGHFALKR